MLIYDHGGIKKKLSTKRLKFEATSSSIVLMMQDSFSNDTFPAYTSALLTKTHPSARHWQTAARNPLLIGNITAVTSLMRYATIYSERSGYRCYWAVSTAENSVGKKVSYYTNLCMFGLPSPAFTEQ
jgi:hypothetical protein